MLQMASPKATYEELSSQVRAYHQRKFGVTPLEIPNAEETPPTDLKNKVASAMVAVVKDMQKSSQSTRSGENGERGAKSSQAPRRKSNEEDESKPEDEVSPSEKEEDDNRCSRCDRRGHIRARCPRRFKSVECDECGEMGHVKMFCPNLINESDEEYSVDQRTHRKKKARDKKKTGAAELAEIFDYTSDDRF
jgi:hypothetical protein